MVIRKNWLAIGIVIMAVFVLAACSKDKEADEGSSSDGGDSQKTLTLSEALEEYPVWMETEGDLSENSSIEGVYHFEDGNVKKYNTADLSLGIEEIMDLSDDQLLDLARMQGEEDHQFLDGKYTLDLMLDDSDQNTQRINLDVQDEQQIDFSFQGENLNQNIEDMNFSGFKINDSDALFTRAGYADSPVELELDSPDADKENITIEKEEERQE